MSGLLYIFSTRVVPWPSLFLVRFPKFRCQSGPVSRVQVQLPWVWICNRSRCYESEFLQTLVKYKKIHEARAFNFTYRYIDDVLSINDSRFAEFLPLIYPPELEV